MIRFPNAKINLGLNVVEKRSDGYHNLETVFYPLPIYDSLEVVSSELLDDAYEFSSSGISIDGSPDKNLVIKALNVLSKNNRLPNVKIHLHKVIPMGGGLGGGSSDGAFMLMILNEMFDLNLNNQQLINYALQLGADCPFFVINKPAFATGVGELLEPISLNLSGIYLVLLNPNIHISTALAFSKVVPKHPSKSVREIIELPRSNWKELLLNDFEPSVFSAYPIIKDIKDSLYQNGAFYASMSGSGSSVYAIFESKPEIISFSDFVIWEGYL